MANVTSIQILEDGPRNVVVKATGTLDSSNVSVATLIDPAVLAVIDPSFPGSPLPNQLQIEYLNWNITEFLTGSLVTPTIQLLWDADTDVVIENLTGNGCRDFKKIGQPLKNNAGTGKTGKINYQVLGWLTGLTLAYTLEIRCLKQLV